MNVKKNPFYFINTLFFLVLTIYSLLVCIRVFEPDNIDMNGGLCAVIVSMVLCLVMYLIYATRVRNLLAANPILKTSLEIISVLIFLTLSCVVHIYMMGEFELDITQEGIVLLCMLMTYLTARMLNQFGFVTLLFLVPWPYLISTYNYNMQELIEMAAVIAGICVLSVILFAVRKKPGLKLAATVLFLIAVVAYFSYAMYQAGLTTTYKADYNKYLECFNKMFEFTQFEKYYFIAVVMAAIISGIRLLLGAGSANTLILFVVNALCCFTVAFDLGPMYLHFMYPLLAMAAAGSLGTRPAHEDEEVQLKDNLENVQVKYNKKDVVGLSYVDDSELDKMLEDIEKDQRYISHKNFSAVSQDEEDNEEVPVELSMYDSALSRPAEEIVSNKTATAVVQEPVASAPVYEPVRPAEPSPVQEPVASAPVYEPVRPTEPAPVQEPVRPVEPAPVQEPVASAPVYEPVRPAAPTPVYEPIAPTPIYESVTATPTYETIEKQPEYHYEEEKPAYEPEYHYEEEESVAEPASPVFFEEPELVVEEEPKQPEVSSYEPEYRYEEEKPAYEPEYRYEEEKPAYEPEYHYEEEEPVAEPASPVFFEEPEPVVEEEKVEQAEEEPAEQPVIKPVYETYETIREKEELQNMQPHVLIENPVSFEDERDNELSYGNEDYEVMQSKPMFETMASFFANNLQISNAPKFEMSQQDAQSFAADSVSEEFYTPINSLDELYTNADAGLEFEEIDTTGQEKPYNEDDELVEEPMPVRQNRVDDFSDMITPVVLDKPVDDEEEFVTETVISQPIQQTIVEPETVDLGLDLGEEFGFGQAVSFTDFYDTDNTSVFAGFEEVQEAEEAEEITVPEFAVETEVLVMESPIIETYVAEAPIIEENAIPAEENVIIPDAVVPEEEDITIADIAAPLKEEAVIPEPIIEPEFVQQPETKNYAYETEIPVQPVPAVEELPVEPVVEKKEKEVVKQVNPFAKEDDFFDWSTYDDSALEEAGPVVEETHNEPIKPKADNDFEEFVWTDEMIKQFAEGAKETTPQTDRRYEEEPVAEVIQEIAATTVPETAFETTVNVSEEEVPQYQVFQPSGNFRIEEPEENEEEVPQYQVFQSSGNFRIEEPEEEEEAPQYQVFQSSGSFQFEEEEEEVAPTLVTYGGPEQQKTEPVTTAPAAAKPGTGKKFDDFEFDLDLPDFEPFDATKR